MPDGQHGRKAKAVFEEAAEIASTQEREAYLDRACAGDQDLRRQVDTLLRALDDAGGFLEVPATYSPETAECDATTSGSSSAQPGDSPTSTGIAAVDETRSPRCTAGARITVWAFDDGGAGFAHWPL